MKVKYAYYRKLDVKFLAELPVSYWRKVMCKRYFSALAEPVTDFSLHDAGNVTVFEILEWIGRVLILPISPLAIELAARNEVKDYKYYVAKNESIYETSVTIQDIKIPSHWPKPQAWEVAE